MNARPKRIRCNISKTRFENLYKTVLTKKRKLTKKGRNHPCARFGKVSTKKKKSTLLIGDKIVLVVIITIRHRLVAIIEA